MIPWSILIIVDTGKFRVLGPNGVSQVCGGCLTKSLVPCAGSSINSFVGCVIGTIRGRPMQWFMESSINDIVGGRFTRRGDWVVSFRTSLDTDQGELCTMV